MLKQNEVCEECGDVVTRANVQLVGSHILCSGTCVQEFISYESHEYVETVVLSCEATESPSEVQSCVA